MAFRIGHKTEGEVSRVETHDWCLDWMDSLQERLRWTMSAELGAAPAGDDWSRR